jgi:hypothetical protein
MGDRPVERESSTRARMRSPVAVPPGWRVRTRSSEGRIALFQPGGQTLDLGGFAGTVETFESDEKTARHGSEFITGDTAGPKPKMTRRGLTTCFGCVTTGWLLKCTGGRPAAAAPFPHGVEIHCEIAQMLRLNRPLRLFGTAAMLAATAGPAHAQNLTLEGQTGGFHYADRLRGLQRKGDTSFRIPPWATTL